MVETIRSTLARSSRPKRATQGRCSFSEADIGRSAIERSPIGILHATGSPVNNPVPLPGLSVFLPSHNEEANVERVVRGYLAALPRFARAYEVIVVNDGSGDRTGEIAERLAAEDSHVRVVHHRVNRG